MAELKIVQGDATKPKPINKNAEIIIPHVCNDIHGWGSGFVLALNKAFGNGPREAYLAWGKGEIDAKYSELLTKYSCHAIWFDNLQKEFGLGKVQFVQVLTETASPARKTIANMVAQHELRGMDPTGRPPIRYGALAECMKDVRSAAKFMEAEIHCPKFGSDLAGGNWQVIQEMIQEIWVDSGINVVVYEWVP